MRSLIKGFAYGATVLPQIVMAQSELFDSIDRSFGSRPFQEAVAAYLDKTAPKIVGGAEALEGQFPWQVSLGVSWIASPASAHFCDGSIFSEEWIVTASHCVDGNRPESIIVTYGTTELVGATQRVNIESILVHADYISVRDGSDVAMLRVREALVLDGQNASPIEYPRVGPTLRLPVGSASARENHVMILSWEK